MIPPTCSVGWFNLLLRMQIHRRRRWHNRDLDRYRNRHTIVMCTLKLAITHCAPMTTMPRIIIRWAHIQHTGMTAMMRAVYIGARTRPGIAAVYRATRRPRTRSHPADRAWRICGGHVVMRVRMRMGDRIVAGIAAHRTASRQRIAGWLYRGLRGTTYDIRQLIGHLQILIKWKVFVESLYAYICKIVINANVLNRETTSGATSWKAVDKIWKLNKIWNIRWKPNWSQIPATTWCHYLMIMAHPSGFSAWLIKVGYHTVNSLSWLFFSYESRTSTSWN